MATHTNVNDFQSPQELADYLKATIHALNILTEHKLVSEITLARKSEVTMEKYRKSLKGIMVSDDKSDFKNIGARFKENVINSVSGVDQPAQSDFDRKEINGEFINQSIFGKESVNSGKYLLAALAALGIVFFVIFNAVAKNFTIGLVGGAIGLGLGFWFARLHDKKFWFPKVYAFLEGYCDKNQKRVEEEYNCSV